MKKLLPILLCYILMTTQVYAISGGPVYGGRGLNPTGTYSGIIQVKSEADYDNKVFNPTTGNFDPTILTGVNALGLFSLGIPTTSVATGSFLLFVEGVVYTGTITASVNPDTDQLNGIVNGTFNYSVSVTTFTGTPPVPTVTSVPITAQANGQIAANISNTRSGSLSSAALRGTSTISVNFGTLGGSSGLQFTPDVVLNCTVSGFRQSTTASSTTITTGT